MDKQKRRELESEYVQPDHWNYKSDPYELRKYDQTLALIGGQRYARALEIGCSEGVFTRRLASVADDVLGLDIVPVALERARAECAGLDNVRFRLFDLDADTLDEQFDLISCAEILYYIRWTHLRPVARKIVRWLRPGGYLVAVHALDEHVAGWGYGPKGAEATHRLFERPGLARLRDQREDGYMLTLFRKTGQTPGSPWADLVEDLCGQNYPALAGGALRRARGWWRRPAAEQGVS